jgi:hypothetical protein
MWLLIFASAAELPLAHLLGPATLRVRYGASHTIVLPWVSGQVNVHARLRRPTMVTTGKGPMEIVGLSFFADDPRALVAHARAVLAPQERRDR